MQSSYARTERPHAGETSRTRCTCCGGVKVCLGQLATIKYFRCTACGMDSSRTVGGRRKAVKK